MKEKRGHSFPEFSFTVSQILEEFLSLTEEAVLIFQNERNSRFFVSKISARLKKEGILPQMIAWNEIHPLQKDREFSNTF